MTIRSVDELDATLAEVNEELAADPTSDDYVRGCAVALQWVTGQRSTGPVDVATSMTADEAAMDDQLAAAIAMLHGHRPMPAPLVSGYLSGVEGTLAWVLGETEEPPL